MSSVLITGSVSGLGFMAAQLLVSKGHQVTVHARNERRAQDASELVPGAAAVVVGDLSRISQMHEVADQANGLGRFDAIIHNAGVGYREPRRVETEDGLTEVFAVNVLAPYLLTALITPPDRLVYLSSGMHRSGSLDQSDPQWTSRPWRGSQAYADSKLADVLLAFAVAARWPTVLSNAVDPGWVATRMGGPDATDDLALGHLTQTWLATSSDPTATVTGHYFFHHRAHPVLTGAQSAERQDALLRYCEELTGVALPVTDAAECEVADGDAPTVYPVSSRSALG